MTQFNGSNGDDIFTGGSGDDTAVGNGGNDSLSGAGGNDLLIGNSGSDTLNGGDGDDYLASGDVQGSFGTYGTRLDSLDIYADHDTLIGGAGNDRLYAGYGDDVDGGAGIDYLSINFLGAPSGVTADFSLGTLSIGGGTIQNVESLTSIIGTNFDDYIKAYDSAGGYGDFTTIMGMGGNDTLIASYYTSSLDGGDGDDVVDGRGSQYLNAVYGGAGNDTLYTNSNTFAAAWGGDGNDTIYAHGEVHGGNGDDTIVMNSSYYGGRVYGDAGNDHIDASTSGNQIAGGGGADTLNGNSGGDSLGSADFSTAAYGAPIFADDTGLEQDVIAGFGGDDVIAAGYGDSADGGAGSDTLRLSLAGATSGITLNTAGIGSGGSVVFAGGTIQNFENFEYLRATEFNDNLTIATQGNLLTIVAGAGDDVITSQNSSIALNGGDGNERFITGAAGDTFDGGNGIDTIDYQQATAGVTVTMTGSSGSGAGGDTFTNVENIYGSAFADSLSGNELANELRGQDGNDTLSGNGGADVLIGGAGTDTLTGGAGNDTFSGTAATLSGDTITDLSIGDKIVLTDASLANFSFNLSGNSLTFSGGSITLSSLPVGKIIASAATGGGVQLTVTQPEGPHDFNGDRRSDFLIRDPQSGWLTNWLGGANGTLSSNSANVSIQFPTDWHVGGTGDFNGDGRDDLLLRNDSGWLTNWLGTSNGGLSNNGANTSLFFAPQWQVVGVADFNGDKKDDLLLRRDDGWLTNWLGTSSGNFTNNGANTSLFFTTDWKVAGTGDFNGDGIGDILLRNDAGWLTDWLGTANGGFTNNGANSSLFFTADWKVVGTGDFNADGISDILLRRSDGWMTDWLGTSNGGFTNNGANTSLFFTTDWHVATIGDFNADGRDDILLRNDSGWMTDWLANQSGSFANNGANFSTFVAPNWHVQDPFVSLA